MSLLDRQSHSLGRRRGCGQRSKSELRTGILVQLKYTVNNLGVNRPHAEPQNCHSVCQPWEAVTGDGWLKGSGLETSLSIVRAIAIIFQALYITFFLPGFIFLNMKGTSQRKFYRDRIKYSQTSSLGRATSGDGDRHPPRCLEFPRALFGAGVGVGLLK